MTNELLFATLLCTKSRLAIYILANFECSFCRFKFANLISKNKIKKSSKTFPTSINSSLCSLGLKAAGLILAVRYCPYKLALESFKNSKK